MLCSFLLRHNESNVSQFVSQAKKTGSYFVRSGYQLLCEVETIGALLGSTDEGVKRFLEKCLAFKSAK